MRVGVDKAGHEHASRELEHPFGPLLLTQFRGLAEFDDPAAFHYDGALVDRRPAQGKNPVGL
jgi:hypothetical protein